MKKLGLLMMLLLLSRIALFCQAQTAGIEEKEVLRNEDVIFHQIDEHLLNENDVHRNHEQRIGCGDADLDRRIVPLEFHGGRA